MKKIVINSLSKFFIVLALISAITGCDAKGLANTLGDAAGAATTGISCLILGC
jgi:hypothetical protein